MGEITLIRYSITLSLPLITQCYKYFWCCVGKKRCENGGCFPPVKDDPNHIAERGIVGSFGARLLSSLAWSFAEELDSTGSSGRRYWIELVCTWD